MKTARIWILLAAVLASGIVTSCKPEPELQLTDEKLLDLVQHQSFKYFYNFAHPVSGLARERNSNLDTVTTGGTGFGLMVLVVGMDRGFITRQEGTDLVEKIVGFLETCDRYHGVWPHWLNGSTGEVIPFSPKDNGADLVETAFLVQGLITVREYLNEKDANEKDLKEIQQEKQNFEESQKKPVPLEGDSCNSVKLIAASISILFLHVLLFPSFS